jgi:hydrogenase large subunit
MATTIVDPVARIEGHLKVRLEIDTGVVSNAELTGNMYRGFENFLLKLLPIDAPLLTQRVCGVCPTAHAIAAALAIDDAARVQAPYNGRIMQNLINGAEFLHSHLLHFYHLALQDYIDMPSSTVVGAGVLDKGPWAPIYGGDRRVSLADTNTLTGHYVAALEMRRKAHTVGAIIAGKQPHAASIIAGGCSANLTQTDIDNMTTLVNEIKTFIQSSYIPDLDLLFDPVSGYYDDYNSIGTGSGNLLSYGVFRQGTGSTSTMLIKRGIYDGVGVVPVMDHNNIVEDISAGWYTGSDNLHPANGETNPDPSKVGGYSWLKAPRYKTDGINKDVYEVGPLARMVVNGSYPENISVADREKARGVEALLVADAMLTWLGDIVTNGLSEPSYIPYEVPPSTTGVGLTEAIRGALGHWVEYDAEGKIAHYQIITPTCWNASPQDADTVHGTIEQALIGLSVADENLPIEAMRVIHSYDPCLACAVHVVRPNGTVKEFIVK